ncbi:MAG: hypothetical protein GY842_18130 [bacterium]|nr:hypothetical protein [bacterium]
MLARAQNRHLRRWSQVATIVAAALVSGCGVNLPAPAGGSVPTEQPTENPVRNPEVIAKTVVLDWSGGFADVSDEPLLGLDFSELYLPSGDSLEEMGPMLQESVRHRVAEILGALVPTGFEVLIGEADDYPDDTVVLFTSDTVPGDGPQVGQTKLDRCDLHASATVIVWGGTLLNLGDEHTFEQWVNVLANIAAHEIGHTVGFFHPDAVLTDLSQHEKDAALMLAVHTLSALLGPQEFLIPQETCPEEMERVYGGVAYELVESPAIKRTPVTYRANLPDDEVVMCNCSHQGH